MLDCCWGLAMGTLPSFLGAQHPSGKTHPAAAWHSVFGETFPGLGLCCLSCSRSRDCRPSVPSFLVPLQQPLEHSSPLATGRNLLGVVSACGLWWQKAFVCPCGKSPVQCCCFLSVPPSQQSPRNRPAQPLWGSGLCPCLVSRSAPGTVQQWGAGPAVSPQHSPKDRARSSGGMNRGTQQPWAVQAEAGREPCST